VAILYTPRVDVDQSVETPFRSIASVCDRVNDRQAPRPLATLKKLGRHHDATLAELGAMPLIDFIPFINPRFEAPLHLAPLVDTLERMRSEPVRMLVSVPPRHGKTETILAALAQMLVRDPTVQIAYVSYSADLAERKSWQLRELCRRLGVPISKDSKSKSNWRTGAAQGGVWACGIGGSLTGEGFDVFVIDDAIKGRAEAESATLRDRMVDWFWSTAYTRLEPSASMLVNMTRWHEDDLIGRLESEGWKSVNLPALGGGRGDEPLWPSRWPYEYLISLREQDAYTWSSLYQGQPTPRGMSVFRDATMYAGALGSSWKAAIGVDFAYSAKTHADWSVAVLLVTHPLLENACIVWDVLRVQESADKFVARLKAFQTQWMGAPILGYIGGSEIGTYQLLRKLGLTMSHREPLSHVDKFVRAQPAATAWNNGRIMVRHCGDRWVEPFLSEVRGFTGIHDSHDDHVDALAAAFDHLSPSLVEKAAAGASRAITGGRPRW